MSDASTASGFTVGGKPIPAAGTSPPQKISDADYDKLTAGEKSVYAAQWPQAHEDKPPRGYREDAAAGRREVVVDGQVIGAESDDGSPKIKLGEQEFSEKEIRDALTAKAEREVAKASLPQTADAYELTLPTDLKLPPGVEFKFAVDDPFLGPSIKQAREFAHEAGLTQPQFEKMLAVYAGSRANEMKILNDARAAELEKLGAAGTARVDAVLTFAKGHGLKHLPAMMVTEGIISDLEKLILRATNGSGSGYVPPRGGDGAESLSDEQWNAMSYSERKEYGRSHENGGRR